MNETHDQLPLTDDELRALNELPREAEPGDLLEERVVRDLRGRGLLGRGVARPVERRWLPRLAAALVLFLTGLVVGQWLGARSTAEAFVVAHRDDTALAAIRVQEAGSAYVASLVALTALDSTEDGEGAEIAHQQLEQGQQAALVALEAAAGELLRLDPDNATLDRVARQLAQRDALADDGATETRQVIWF